MFQDRRQHERLTPTTPQLVLLDETKYSLLFDLCEGGLAIEGFAAQKPLDEFTVELDLPGSRSSIQAKAEVVWTSTTGYRTGFRFVALQAGNREQLKAWLAGAKSSRTTVEREAQLDLALEGVSDDPEARFTESGQTKGKTQVEHRSAIFPISQSPATEPGSFETGPQSVSEPRLPAFAGLLVISAAMCVLAFYMGYYWRASHSGTRPVQPTVTAAPVPAAKIAPKASSGSPPEATPPAAAEAAFSEPGLVLQVAAMKSEANAEALSVKLQNKNFSVFVFKRGSGRFYRVVVGPFRTQDLAVQAQRELRARGYKSLLRPWSPE